MSNDGRIPTVNDLEDILTFDSGGCFHVEPENSHDEVFPGLFIGDEDIAKDPGQLQQLGITHVLNAGHGDHPYQVTTDQHSYDRRGIHFMGVPAFDIDTFDLVPYFHSSAEFIHEALSQKARILVHCRQGVSRSATLVVAYLMIKRQFCVRDAIRMVRKSREIFPNSGFLQQLCDLDRTLKRGGHDEGLTIDGDQRHDRGLTTDTSDQTSHDSSDLTQTTGEGSTSTESSSEKS